MVKKKSGRAKGKRAGKECTHEETGTRYLFTPKMGEKVIAITYCKRCGKELSRESVSVKKES